jgi:hypothetical protein
MICEKHWYVNPMDGPKSTATFASGGQNPFRQWSLVISHLSLVKKEKHKNPL